MRVQWKGDNQGEVENLLAHHLARTVVEGSTLYITGIDGLHVEADLGDWIQVRGDSLGVQRPPRAGEDRFVIWKGDNVVEISEFVKEWQHIHISVTGSQLLMQWDGREAFINRGDRLLIRNLKSGSQLYVSRAGKDHRM